MHSSNLTSIYDRWTRPSYEVRVRGTTTPMYLWGSAGIAQNMSFDKPLLLHIRNDLFGQPITFGTQTAGTQTVPATQTTFGTLSPGECVSIPLQNISGVFATCEFESVVACVIHQS